jgi:hypothetical protein
MNIKKQLCCICDEVATKKHMSFFGQIPFPVCNFHFENTGTMYSIDPLTKKYRMGLGINGKFIDIKDPERIL